MSQTNRLLRHISALQNITLPGDFVPFHLGPTQVGWLSPANAATLIAQGTCTDMPGGGLALPDPAALAPLARSLAEAGHFPHRGELFDVRAAPDAPVLTTIDRGAIAWFGLRAEGAHLNGLVRTPGGISLWVARRAANRLIDPGMLDHLCAGGIAAGSTPFETLLKEAAEEAALPPALTRTAQHVATLHYTTLRPEGLRRDRLHCYDLWLPPDFHPTPTDGEVEAFELWPIEQLIETLATQNRFKFNVNLVLLNLLTRLNLLP